MSLRPLVPPAWAVPALQALACIGLVLALYHPALNLYFVGDDIAFVHPNPDWLRTALLPAGEWHYYPLTVAGFALLGIASDWRPGPLHLLNLLLHASVGVGLALWLARFGIAAWARTLAALFFICRGIHYEVVIWITELSYLAVALYTLVTLACWDRFLRGDGRRFLVWTALGFAAAVFTIEHALILAPLYVLYDFALKPRLAATEEGIPPGRVSSWSSLAPRSVPRDALKYIPFVLIALTFLSIKQAYHVELTWSGVAASLGSAPAPIPSGMDVTTQPPPERSWQGMLNRPLRAYLDLLSATQYLILPSFLSHGAEDNWLTRHRWLSLLPWLALHIGVIWRGRPLARFLLGWIYLYELPLAVAGVPVARYYYMPAVPAAALVAIGADAAVRWFARRGRRIAPAAAVIGLFTAMVVGESRFIRARTHDWALASDIVRTTVAELQRTLPAAPTELVLVNLPYGVPGPYWPAYALVNAAKHLPLMLRPPRRDVRVHVVYDRTFVDGRWPTIGQYGSRDTTRHLTTRPATMVYEFIGRPPWITPLK